MTIGYIYAIGAAPEGPVKIGMTTGTPDARLKALQTAHPTRLRLLAVVQVGGYRAEIERTIHTLLAAERLAGEWFAVAMDQARLDTLLAQACDQLRIEPFAQPPDHEQAPTKRMRRTAEEDEADRQAQAANEARINAARRKAAHLAKAEQARQAVERANARAMADALRYYSTDHEHALPLPFVGNRFDATRKIHKTAVLVEQALREAVEAGTVPRDVYTVAVAHRKRQAFLVIRCWQHSEFDRGGSVLYGLRDLRLTLEAVARPYNRYTRTVAPRRGQWFPWHFRLAFGPPLAPKDTDQRLGVYVRVMGIATEPIQCHTCRVAGTMADLWTGAPQSPDGRWLMCVGCYEHSHDFVQCATCATGPQRHDREQCREEGEAMARDLWEEERHEAWVAAYQEQFDDPDCEAEDDMPWLWYQ